MSGDVMRIECRSCGEVVSAEDINIDKMVAKCSSCHAVFGFQLEGEARPKRERANVAMPKSVTVEDFGGELVITHRWRNIVAVIFLVIFSVIWNGVTWTFFVSMLDEDGMGFFALFLSLFVVVGLFVGYFTLAVMLNSTEIRVSSRRLTVKHGPLPVPGSVDIPSDQIDQVWVEEKISTSRGSDGHTSTSVHYPVFARMTDGTKKVLIRYGHDSDLSLFLEQEIEEHLGIEDRAVRGEF